MFPGVYGFTWDAGNVIFLGIFFTVALIIASTVTLAALRSWRDIRQGKEEAIQWKEDFHDLPVSLRTCRHELTGELKERTCPNGFDCRVCTVHPTLVQARPNGEENGRLFHRGHTWVQRSEDGSYLVGLDEIGRKLFGDPESLSLPAPGSRLSVNGKAWSMKRGGMTVRVLSPLDGVVLERGTAEGDWILKIGVEEGSPVTTHLLTGREEEAWRTRELERLQFLLGGSAGPALADGGELMDDLPKRYPSADWDSVWGEMFLEG